VHTVLCYRMTKPAMTLVEWQVSLGRSVPVRHSMQRGLAPSETNSWAGHSSTVKGSHRHTYCHYDSSRTPTAHYLLSTVHATLLSAACSSLSKDSLLSRQ